MPLPINDDVIKEIIKNNFTVENDKRILRVKDIHVDQKPELNLQTLKKKFLFDETDGIPVKGTIELYDKDKGKVIDKSRVRLVTLPRKNETLDSYLVNGNYYNLIKTLRMEPGVYTKIKNDGKIESQFNIANKFNFRIVASTEGLFYIKVRRQHLLYPILKRSGITDADLKEAWGEKIFNLNKDKAQGKEDKYILSLAEDLYHKRFVDVGEAYREVRRYLDEGKINPEISGFTLGSGYSNTGPRTLLASTKKLINVYQGKEDPDTKALLIYKRMYDDEDYFKERLAIILNEFAKKSRTKLNKVDKISKLFSGKKLTDSFKRMFNLNISEYASQVNPVTTLDTDRLVTILAEGAIGDANAITLEDRNVSPSGFGFIDPVKTPESGKVGVNTFLTFGAEKGKDNKLYQTVFNTHSQKYEKIDHVTLYQATKALADDYDKVSTKERYKPKKKRVTGFREDKTLYVSPEQIDYIVEPSLMFSPVSLFMPFINHNQANRILTSAKMVTQSLPLANAEPPLVEPRIQGQPWHEFNSDVISIRSPIDGTIAKIDEDRAIIHIRPDKGPEVKIPYSDNFPLNEHSFISFKPADGIKEGKKIRKGDLIIVNAFVKDGKLATGTNLRSMYKPAEGWNFEDGIVISETASNKLKSVHFKTYEINKKGNIFDINQFKDMYPALLTGVDVTAMDATGMPKRDSIIRKGMAVYAYIRDTGENDPAVQALMKINPKFKLKYRPVLNVWEEDFEGKVVAVVDKKNHILIKVRTEEPAVVGDKLSGRYGNKGVITRVIPDSNMPRDEKGNQIDIVLNPIGVPSRMNVGQVLEALAGKIAAKEGKPYYVDNDRSDQDYLNKLTADLKKAGLSEDEKVTYRGVEIPGVTTGNSYIYKLMHKVDKKMKARDFHGPYTQLDQPARGGHESAIRVDQLTLYAMLAHGTPHILEDFRKYKSVKDPDLVRAVEKGEPLPVMTNDLALEKFRALINSLGVDLQENRGETSMIPFTNEQIKEMTGDRVVTNSTILRAKDMKAEEDGLFDPKLTGGSEGTLWSRINLSTPLPNPLFEKPIKSILGMSDKEYRGLLANSVYIDTKTRKILDGPAKGAVTGGKGLLKILQSMDTKRELKSTLNSIEDAPQSKKSNLYRKAKYLKALSDNKISPDVYMLKHVPVIPPKYRPMYISERDGKRQLMVSDLNYLYKELMDAMEMTKELKGKDVPEFFIGEYKLKEYDSIKGIMGLGGTKQGFHDLKGALDEIAGPSPKEGLYQGKLVARRMNLSGGSVVTVNPKLDSDHMGVPYDIAKKLYRPVILGKMVRSGIATNALEAGKKLDEDDPAAVKLLYEEVKERPILVNRSPTLHKYGIMSFFPILTQKGTFEVPPLVMKGYNMDIDGDSCISSTILNLTMPSEYANIWLAKQKEGEKMPQVKKTIVNSQENGTVLIRCAIENFPHDKSKYRVNKKGTIFAPAYPGTKVLSLDENGKAAWMPVTEFSIHPDLNGYTIKTLYKREVGVSEDHSLCAYNTISGKIEKCKPVDSINSAVPIVKKAQYKKEDAIYTIPFPYDLAITGKSSSNGLLQLPANEIICDRKFGHWIGSFVSDGWSDLPVRGTIHYSKVEVPLVEAFSNQMDRFVPGLGERSYTKIVTRNDSKMGIFNKKSSKTTFNNAPMARVCLDWFGKKAANKKLPKFFVSLNEDCLWGLLSGLLDGDGSVSINNRKGKRQTAAVGFDTTSPELRDDILTLCKILGIRASYITYRSNCYRIQFSLVDIYNNRDKIQLLHPGKAEALSAMPEPTRDFMDMVPITTELARAINKNRKLIGNSNYTVLNKCINKGDMINRANAKALIEMLDGQGFKAKGYTEWKRLVANETIFWDKIVEIEPLGETQTMYDITVPGSFVFAIENGLVVWDTVHVHVPLSDNAKTDAYKMLPSNNLFNPASGQLMLGLSHEMVVGVYLLTKDDPTGSAFKIKSYEQLHDLVRIGKIKPSRKISMEGMPSTSAGRAIVNYWIPKDLRIYSKVWDKGIIKNLLDKIAKKYESDYPMIVDRLKNIGNTYSTYLPYSVGLKDLKGLRKQKTKIFDAATKKEEDILKMDISEEEKDEEIIALYKKVDKEIKHLIDSTEDNDIVLSYKSGARTSLDQVKQVLAAPVLVEDVTGKTIPVPIKHGYGEGLSFSEMFPTFYGARKGVVDKVYQVQEPGAFTKRLMQTSINEVVTEKDCGTHKGIMVNLATNASRAINRYLATHIKDAKGNLIYSHNELVTQNMINNLLKKKIDNIMVRSPMTCEAKQGICSLCYGANVYGRTIEVGTNIGVIAAESLGEPLTQMTMKTFHTGGVAADDAGVVKGFFTLKELLNMPQNSVSAATLSDVEGVVEEIEEALKGYHVKIRTGTEPKDIKDFVIDKPMEPAVNVGDIVKPGNSLGTGMLYPNKLLESLVGDKTFDQNNFKELEKIVTTVKNTFVNDVSSVYKSQGINLDARIYETLANAMLGSVRVVESDRMDFIPDDTIKMPELVSILGGKKLMNISHSAGERLAQKLGDMKAGDIITKKDISRLIEIFGNIKINVEDPYKGSNLKVIPFTKGINAMPHEINDWLTKLNFERLKKVMETAVTTSETSYLNNYFPIPSYVFNEVEKNIGFQKLKEEKYK